MKSHKKADPERPATLLQRPYKSEALMPKDRKDEARSIANSSGFPLQIKIAHDSNLPKEGYVGGWHTFLEEHPWSSNETSSGGFIDLIVLSDRRSAGLPSYVMVIECKRVKDSTYVFLVPKKNGKSRSYAKIWVSSFDGDSKNDIFGWHRDSFDPVTYESKFCAIQGAKKGRKTILEKIAFELVESVEAFALHEKRLMDAIASNAARCTRFYVPVIITTAKLIVAQLDPSSISVKDGTLPDDSSFEEVPYVRFCKSLSSCFYDPNIKTVEEAYGASERTVFIVNSEHWVEFLHKWERQN